MLSAMTTAVSNLKANTYKLESIAQNIASQNNTGYKRVSVDFSTLVTTQQSNNTYSPGGTKANIINYIDEKGDLNSSTSTTDFAVDGSGYFVVSPQIYASGETPSFFYTRAGSFAPDNNGYLVNKGGFYLQGFKTDTTGTPTATNTSILGSLEPVNVSRVNGISNPTQSLKMQANIPSESAVGYQVSETIEVYDTLGVGRPLDFHWTKIAQTGLTQTWHLSVDSPDASFQKVTKNGGAPYGGLLTGLTLPTNGFSSTPINDSYTSGYTAGALTGTISTSDPINFPSTITVQIGSQTFRSINTVAPVAGGKLLLTDINNSSNILALDYDTTDVSAIADPTSLASALTSLLGSAEFNTNGMVVVFDQNGLPVSFDGAVTPPPITIDWSDSLTNAADSQITLDLGAAETSGGIICKAGPYNLSYSSQDGVRFGNFIGVQIESNGILSANFDNGQNLYVYQIPLADFANPNAMTPYTGDVYAQTESSGTYLLKTSGQGGVGSIVGSTLESSTVDLPTEFSNLIVAQRAFTANTRIITTADEMLNDLVHIR